MKKSALIFALAVGLLTSASTAMAQTVNMSRYITLTVTDGAAITLDFKAAAAGTPVRIVNGSVTRDITVGTNWKGIASYTADGTTMTVYGDIVGFNCSSNLANLTALDVSHNTQLEELDCGGNKITALNVSKNTQLEKLGCAYNKLTALDVSKNTQLKELLCPNNKLTTLDLSHNAQLKTLNCSSSWLTTLDLSHNAQLTRLYCSSIRLTALDVSHNTQLNLLDCSSNQLTALDVSHNTQLWELNCGNNQLTALNVSHNTQLSELVCYDNALNTAALDRIYCTLPDRTSKYRGVIKPVYSDTSSNHVTVLATNKTNATSKNWKVQYADNTDIPATTGSYTCPQPNMSRYITLAVAKDSAIKLDFMAAAAGTPVRIVSGSNTQNITVGTSWYGTATYTADDTEMKVYGDLIGFDCSANYANLTAFDLSQNTQLRKLHCRDNSLSSLNVSKNTLLEDLYCGSNNLTTLDVSACTQLKELYCYNNDFTTAALDDIYCALPDRTGKENGVIKPVFNSSLSYNDTVIATNAQNATDKNWKVQYYQGDTDISTTGSYVCGGGGGGGTTTYNLKIADVQVTSTNCSDLSVIDSVSGTVKYDPSTKTLTLQNATISVNTTNAIKSYIDGLTIKVIGTNNLTTSGAALYFRKPLTITGGGVLNANSGDVPAIFANGTNLTIDGCTVNAKGKWGISGFNGSSETLTIKNSTVTAEGIYGSIVDFAGITLDGCAITQPAGAAFDASLKAVALNGEKVTSKVVISKNSTDIAEATAEQALTLYPNPVADILYLSATARTIRVYDIYGTEVAHATDTDRVEVSHLPAGVYTVRADGTVAKMVKR